MVAIAGPGNDGGEAGADEKKREFHGEGMAGWGRGKGKHVACCVPYI